MASLTAVYFRPLAILPTLPIASHDSKNAQQDLAQECNAARIEMNFCFQEQQKQCIAQLMVLELSTGEDSKFPLQGQTDGQTDLRRGAPEEYRKLNLGKEKEDQV